jgi:hypothetical protein
MTSTSPLSPRFTGWTRLPGCRWEQVCTGQSYGETFRQLLAVEVIGHGVDRLVTEGSRDPNSTSRRGPRQIGQAAPLDLFGAATRGPPAGQ